MTQEERVKDLGMTSEQLTGRSMFMEFDPGETERFEYPWAPQVDFNKRTELDTADMTSTEVNSEIRDLMSKGYGTIVLKNKFSVFILTTILIIQTFIKKKMFSLVKKKSSIYFIPSIALFI